MKLPPRFCNQAFSLVEVAMALGLFSFAVMGLLGLLPVALQTHREAKVSTILAQIEQRMAAELLLTDGAELAKIAGKQHNFDVEGRELDDTEKAKTVYSAKILLNGAILPGGATSVSLQRATLFAVANPSGNDNISTTSPTASLLVTKAETATAP